MYTTRLQLNHDVNDNDILIDFIRRGIVKQSAHLSKTNCVCVDVSYLQTVASV